MTKRKTVADDEQAQLCKKLKLKPLDNAADAAFSATSSSLEVKITQATQDAHEDTATQEVPSSERRIKRKATDCAESSQAGEPDTKRTKTTTSTPEEPKRRARSPMRLHFKWKDYVPQPEKKIAASQRQWYDAPRQVAELFAAWPETDSETEAKRNGLPSPSSSVHGDAVHQPAALPGAHHLMPSAQPAPQPEGAAGRSEPDSRVPVARLASVSGITQVWSPTSGQPSASRSSSASPPPSWMHASSSRRRLNKGKAPATHSDSEEHQAPRSPEKRMPPLDKKKKKKHGKKQRKAQESGPEAKSLQGFLRSTRSSRRGGKCELWHLGDDGVATCSVN
ncbi:hypothetical protein V8C44DRAFT_329928 [Trichoderma aethiopicum]